MFQVEESSPKLRGDVTVPWSRAKTTLCFQGQIEEGRKCSLVAAYSMFGAVFSEAKYLHLFLMLVLFTLLLW